MKKTMLSILSLTAMVAITGCSSTAVPTTIDVTPKIQFKAESISLNGSSYFLYPGETFQLKPTIFPVVAYDAALVYTSSDEGIVTVSSTGLVTAVGEGTAVVTVKAKENTSAIATMKFYCLKMAKSVDHLTRPIQNMSQYQKRYVNAPRKILSKAYITYTYYCDEVITSQTLINQDIMMDKDMTYNDNPCALFELSALYQERRITDSPFMRSTVGYKVLTDKDYHSYIFHDNDTVHNWLYVPTEFYLGTETTRDLAVYALIDSLLVSGSDIVDDRIEDSLGTEWFGYPSMRRSGAYTPDNTEKLYIYLTQDVDRTATGLTENNLGIPAETPYNDKGYFKVYFERGNVKFYEQHFVDSYEYKGHNYVIDVKQCYSFYRDDEFESVYPDFGSYTKVDKMDDL